MDVLPLDRARTAALAAVTAELQRCASLLAREDEDAKRVAFLDQDISRARARISVLEQQITDHVAQAGSLAEALSRILPHVQSEHCPVCERDFAEVSTTPLQAHVSARIASLTESAGRLQALSRERASTTSTLASAERERSLISSRQLSPAARDETKTRRARLEEIHQTLTGLIAAKDGERLIEIAASAARRVGDQRSGDQQAMALRDAVSTLAAEALAAPLTTDETGPVEATLETHYRSGGKGGNPRAMLSAGNLNTAALTLFLALHLSVEPSIPCLVIDDPIQSMDEVHIAQFAALLRTLAKSHGRQVVIRDGP